MQVNRTSPVFDDVMEYILPSTFYRIYRDMKKAYAASKLFVNVFLVHLFLLFFKERNRASDLYRKIWKKEKPIKESKDTNEELLIHPFKISVPDSVLEDLKFRLERTRLGTSLKDSNFDNLFHPECLRKLIDYWKTDFDWRKREKELNKYPHFKTRIENIDLHFLHFKSKQTQNHKVKLIPLLLIHNWPGTFADFHKIIPILQTSGLKHGLMFEIVCPSIPGCGFSEAPLQKNFSAINLSKLLLALMDRLGYTEFYVHGYGWGAITASLMARYYPYRVKGLHVNMCFALPNLFDSFIKTLVVCICPFFINTAEYNIVFPLKKKIRMLIEETGFLHMQCTKPDTLGYAVSDSPTILALNVLERFLFQKNSANFQQRHQDMPENYLDDLLTTVTILWVGNNFNTGARFFKESISDLLQRNHDNGIPLIVPCGIAFFPEEIFMFPKYIWENMAEDLVSYTVMPKGGHLAAIEEPCLLAKDIREFVQVVENRFPEK